MVIPWIGFPLADLLKQVEPTSKAKYVAFATLRRPAEMPGQRQRGARVAVRRRPAHRRGDASADDPRRRASTARRCRTQNGAPLRLVVPWKYGFKGIKSIVRISLVEKQPPTSWNIANAREYGFYSNVNPTVDHPRWRQSRERRIGEFVRRPTLMFNGYGDQVASLYTGMDLKKNY